MISITKLPLGGYETNCYIVGQPNRTDCVIIDPGYEAGAIMDTLADMGRKPTAIFLTHGHFDHVGAVPALVNHFDCRLWVHKKDWALSESELYPLANQAFPHLRFFEQEKVVTEAGMDFAVHHTPGHTEGSVCLVCENALFTGDTLFAGSCGRTDLYGGDNRKMQASLAYLHSLISNHEVYPGHGSNSCLDAERRYNPYLKGLL